MIAMTRTNTCTKTVPRSKANRFISLSVLSPQASQVNCTIKLLLGSFMSILASYMKEMPKKIEIPSSNQ